MLGRCGVSTCSIVTKDVVVLGASPLFASMFSEVKAFSARFCGGAGSKAAFFSMGCSLESGVLVVADFPFLSLWSCARGSVCNRDPLRGKRLSGSWGVDDNDFLRRVSLERDRGSSVAEDMEQSFMKSDTFDKKAPKL